MMDIQPQYVTLGRLMQGRLFQIPEYQRTYSWGKKQRADLFQDILRTWKSGEDTQHFMATIVGLRKRTQRIIADDYHVIDVVDGQQRITTLILLFRAIAQALDRKDDEQKMIGKDIDAILVKPDKASLLLLQTNHDTSHHFATYVRNGIHPVPDEARTLADRELLLAMQECEDFVSAWKTDVGPLADLVVLLKNRLTFIFHEIGDEKLVYTVFEVLNSRGLDVSWFDRLKSMLMAVVFNATTGNKDVIIDELHKRWTEIYRTIGIRPRVSTEVLRFAATLRSRQRPNRPLGEAEAVETLHSQTAEEPAKVIEVTEWLQAVTEATSRLADDRRLNAVTRIVQARLVAVAVHLRTDLTEEEKSRILRRWENVTFRIYGMLRKDARTSVGDYVRLAWRIHKEGVSADRILESLSEIGSKYRIGEAIDGLSETDCYTGWQEELRYLFFRYEEHLAREAGQNYNNEQWNRIWISSPAQSIEHILAQSAGDEETVHRLGNLVLLPPRLNSKLGTKRPEEKQEDYVKAGLLITQDAANWLPGWSIESIENREMGLLEWAVEEWDD